MKIVTIKGKYLERTGCGSIKFCADPDPAFHFDKSKSYFHGNDPDPTFTSG